jgi:hypothetical protein
MNTRSRPLTVTIVACLYIAVGAIGFAYHLYVAVASGGFKLDDLMVELTELAALVSGVFMLRGASWARWLALAWMAFHVLISLGSAQEIAVHTLFLVAIACGLFNRKARGYFQTRDGIKISEGPNGRASPGQ